MKKEVLERLRDESLFDDPYLHRLYKAIEHSYEDKVLEILVETIKLLGVSLKHRDEMIFEHMKYCPRVTFLGNTFK